MLLAIFHGFLAILLFFLVNWIGRHSAPFGYRTLSLYERVEEAPAFNFLFRVAVPQVFIVLIAALLSVVGHFSLAAGIWRVTAFYFLARILFNLIMGRAVLINWWTQSGLGAVATGISYWLSESVLTTPQRALPNPADLTTELWLLVLLFLYQTVNQITITGTRQARRQDRYLSGHYTRFRQRYQAVVAGEVSSDWVEALVYSVLIFEDFNRPAVMRLIESYVLFPLGLASTLGPMQVAVDRRVSDEEGVRLGARRIAALYPTAEAAVLSRFAGGSTDSHSRWLRGMIGRQVAVDYNPDGEYADEVQGIYDVVIERYYGHLWKAAEAAA